MATTHSHSHRRRRPDRLRAAVPDRERPDARPGRARSTSGCSRSRTPSRRPRAPRWSCEDCAFPLLASASRSSTTPTKAFDGVNVALLVGARPRTKGMERADLLEANGQIFKPQGEALNAGAADDVKVLVVGNPANTNALIAHEQRAGRPARALHGDDPPRPEPRDRAARRQAGRRRWRRCTDLAIWGNHSPTMFPDLFNAKVNGERAVDQVDIGLVRERVHPARGQARRRDHRRARRLERRAAPPTPRSTTCTTGSSGADGDCARWRSARTARTTWTRG